MKVMVKASKSSEAGEMPSQQLLTEMGQFNEELVKAGIMLAGEGLKPSREGKRIRFSGKDRLVIDGPFAETKELVAGYWMWNVKSMEEAVEWVRRCPNPMSEESEIEIRPVFSAEDFGDEFTPELREQEAAVLAKSIGLSFPRFESIGQLTIAGLNETYTFETRVNIPKQWERFAPHIGKVPGQVGSSSYGVVWNHRPGSGFDYLTGVEVSGVDKLPAGFTHVSITPQRYAIFTHEGPISSIGKTIESIWMKWVPECGLKPADRPCLERYAEDFDSRTGTGLEIWVAVLT